MINNTQVAILLATYQGEKYIQQQLDSLLNQSYTNWTAYIHDDGSKDNTIKILNEYSKKYPDKFFILDGSSTGGAKNNFFYLTENVESDLYMYCDQDDVWLKDKIQKTFDAMQKINHNNNPALVHTDLKIVDESLNTIANSMNRYQKLNCTDNSLGRLLIQNKVTGCTMMINRSLRDKMIINCNKDNIIMHDWWAAIIASAFGSTIYISSPTILYRQHSDNSVGAKKTGSLKNIFHLSAYKNKVIKSLKATSRQAAEFYNSFKYECPEEAKIFSDILKYNKSERLKIYRKYDIKKSSFVANLGMIFFG